MQPFKLCPVCGGEVIQKNVEKLVKGGKNIAVLHVAADVCLHCGERLYSKKTVQQFELVRKKLEKQEVDEFQLLGQSYEV